MVDVAPEGASAADVAAGASEVVVAEASVEVAVEVEAEDVAGSYDKGQAD